MRAVFRWKRDERGVAAIEFAILGLPFFLILFGILETGLAFTGEITIGHATERMARQVRIGEVAKSQMALDTFRNELCDAIALPVTCDKLKIDLRSYSTFADVAEADLHHTLSASPAFDRGRPGEIMALQVSYEWPIFADIMRKYLASPGQETYAIHSVTVFRTEPFV